MSFASLVHRARADVTITPRLELTLPLAVRLWGLGVNGCRFVVDSLVDAGCLRWTARLRNAARRSGRHRSLVRTGRDRVIDRRLPHIPVRSMPRT
jgi:hypothetical protein